MTQFVQLFGRNCMTITMKVPIHRERLDGRLPYILYARVKEDNKGTARTSTH